MMPIAEGVEDAAQLEFLRRAGCELVQGFHLARPAPAETFAAALAEPPRAPVPLLRAAA